MRKLLVAACISIAVVGASLGCGSDPAVQIPDEPVPMPKAGPESAGSSLPRGEPETQP